MRDASIIPHGSRYDSQIVSFIVGHTARTEQQSMTGRSIETLVERRNARRQQLDLRVADGPVLA